MPYALKEKQREAQKLWARENKKAPVSRAKEINPNLDHARVKLGTSTITWEELQEMPKFNNLTRWGECVDEARKYMIGTKANRLILAELALKACEIKRGGKRLKAEEMEGKHSPTLKAFAALVGVHHKTLHDWVRVKLWVVDSLPTDLPTIDFTAARLALDHKADKDEKQIAEMYFKFSDVSSPKRQILNVRRYWKSLIVHLEKHGTKGMKKSEIEEMHKAACFVVRVTKSA